MMVATIYLFVKTSKKQNHHASHYKINSCKKGSSLLIHYLSTIKKQQAQLMMITFNFRHYKSIKVFFTINTLLCKCYIK